MRNFLKEQESRIKVLEADFEYRKQLRAYALECVNEDRSDENLDRLSEVKQDYLIATIRLAEAQRALNYYERYKMWETAEFKKEYTG